MAFILPSWFMTLRQQTSADFQWLSTDEIENYQISDEDIKRRLEHWNLTEEEWQKAFDLLQRRVPVGSGPTFYGSIKDTYYSTTQYWIDKQDPSDLLVALDSACLPHLWFPAGHDLATIEQTLQMYHTRQSDDAQRTAQYGLFAGIMGDTPLEDIENALLFQPCFGGFRLLGSGYAQRGHDPKITEIWTINSHSLVRLIWFDQASTLLAHIHYPPAQQDEVIAEYNRSFGYHLPLNTPLDVAELLFGFANMDADHVYNMMQGLPAKKLHFWLSILSNMLPNTSPEAVTTYLQPFASHPSKKVRKTLADIARTFSLSALLRLLLEHENDEKLRSHIQAALMEIDPSAG